MQTAVNPPEHFLVIFLHISDPLPQFFPLLSGYPIPFMLVYLLLCHISLRLNAFLFFLFTNCSLHCIIAIDWSLSLLIHSFATTNLLLSLPGKFFILVIVLIHSRISM
jgi:hypothetical protein